MELWLYTNEILYTNESIPNESIADDLCRFWRVADPGSVNKTIDYSTDCGGQYEYKPVMSARDVKLVMVRVRDRRFNYSFCTVVYVVVCSMIRF